MNNQTINLYSDTQTLPSAPMRRAIADAEVGDEQRGADPTVNRLCARAAEWLGKEEAVFLPSGTMCNEIAILVHCRAGDEVYAHATSHIIGFEGGGPSVFAGVHLHALPGAHGLYSAATLAEHIRVPNRYTPRPALVEVEQTANLGGGTVWPLSDLDAVVDVAKSHALTTHMDGARLPNAAVASGVDAARIARGFDSVWIDLSKGLGCPVGAVLAGDKDFIAQCWRWKQRMGGAMRQAGIVAAAGLYAFDHNIERLAQDHENAARFADRLSVCDGVSVVQPQTNIVVMDITQTGVNAHDVSKAMQRGGVTIGAFTDSMMRAVTHLDVNSEDVERAASLFLSVVEDLRA